MGEARRRQTEIEAKKYKGDGYKKQQWAPNVKSSIKKLFRQKRRDARQAKELLKMEENNGN